ncbi:MAG: hypothetical protein Q9227_003156 [Pyrenula ochraceoflavens]
MPRLSDGLPSSPPSASASSEEALAYYKAQYENLEAELADFQNSSRELEAELERDIEASEQRERQLKEKADDLAYEVEEWKTKCKSAKTDAGSVQNNLQKEITTLRDTNRTLQLKLRDIEVANDDFERQARHTESSLEDMESKYSQAIERSIMLEEDIKNIDQEREGLRIEAQRVKDELSDLKIETEILNEKLRNAERSLESQRQKPALQAIDIPDSPAAETSSTASSPFCTTPPAPSNSSGPSDAATPPSPPFSEKSTKPVPKPTPKPAFVTPTVTKSRPSTKSDTTPRPSNYSAQPLRQSRGPSIPVPNSATPAARSKPAAYRQSTSRPSAPRPAGLPSSNSVYQLRNLRGKMANLEARVHSAKSKLPAPVSTPPRASPRSGSAVGHQIPNSVTVRSRRRNAGSMVSGTSSAAGDQDEATPVTQHTPSVRSKPSISRLSMGGSARDPHIPPTPTRRDPPRPGSRTSAATNRYSTYQPGHSRPGSRASISNLRGLGGAPKFLPNASTDGVRPTSSLSSYGMDGAMDEDSLLSSEGGDKDNAFATPTPRRSTFGRTSDVGLPESSIPTPSAFKKRDSVGGASRLPIGNRRISSGVVADRPGSQGADKRPNSRASEMRPPSSLATRNRGLSDVGETY